MSSKYIVTVQECTQEKDPQAVGQAMEILKCGIDTFDLLTFVQALTATKRGRPAKKPAKEAA
jgi:hypothetical protein